MEHVHCPHVLKINSAIGRIHLVHLRILKYFTDDSSVNFMTSFFFTFFWIWAKNEEKTCHGNSGEFGHSHMTSSSRKIGTDRFFSVEDKCQFGIHDWNSFRWQKKIRFVSQNVIIWICGWCCPPRDFKDRTTYVRFSRFYSHFEILNRKTGY